MSSRATPAETRRRFAAGLRAARKLLGITVIKAAKRCGVKRSTYYSWESEDRMPRGDDIPTIADKMSTTVTALYGEVVP